MDRSGKTWLENGTRLKNRKKSLFLVASSMGGESVPRWMGKEDFWRVDLKIIKWKRVILWSPRGVGVTTRATVPVRMERVN